MADDATTQATAAPTDGLAPGPHEPPSSLDAMRRLAWQELAVAVSNRRHGFHTLALVTTDELGLPTARMVVLRRVLVEERLIVCHADARSPKAQQVMATGFASWLAYDKGRRMQLRLAGPARFEQDGPFADFGWHASRMMSRRCYLAPQPPSDVATEPTANLPDHLEGVNPTPAESEAGRQNFGVVVATVATMDVLHLHHAGHRRARFRWDEAGKLDEHWTAP